MRYGRCARVDAGHVAATDLPNDWNVSCDDTRPLVAIVLVGYGEKGTTAACIASLATIDYASLSIIYVDNASPDDALGHVRSEFPDVLAIPSGGNLGYCGGNNVGIALALERGAAFILLLNPDTVVCNPKFVSRLVDYMRDNPHVGKVGPKVYLRSRDVVQNTILHWPSLAGSVASVLSTLWRSSSRSTSATVTQARDVAALNGCCVLVRAEMIRDVGMLDATFWGYVDEVEWDWRAERAGWKRHFVPVDSIVHLQREGGYGFASRVNFYIKRNTALWYAKTGKWASMAAWMAVTLAIAIARCAASPFLGRSPAEFGRFVVELARAYAGILHGLVRGNRSGGLAGIGTLSARKCDR